jgi:O-antigen ligase
MVRQRVDLAISSYTAYSDGQIDNGTAARLELWKVSFRLLEESPFVGIKPRSLNSKLTAMKESGAINDLVMNEGMAEMHSEIASRMAKYGALGLLMALAPILVLGWFGCNALNAETHIARGAARMVLCLFICFYIFGLTVEVFNIKMVAAFYGLTIASLFGIALGATCNKTPTFSSQKESA